MTRILFSVSLFSPSVFPIAKQGRSEELIPLREYLLRHDKAIFWVLESMIPFGNHPLFLALLGWMLPPKPAFMKFTTTPVGEYKTQLYELGFGLRLRFGPKATKVQLPFQ